MDILDQFFNEGKNAANESKSFIHCPYDLVSKEGYSWMRGWEQVVFQKFQDNNIPEFSLVSRVFP